MLKKFLNVGLIAGKTDCKLFVMLRFQLSVCKNTGARGGAVG
jgi:hypothetical protein